MYFFSNFARLIRALIKPLTVAVIALALTASTAGIQPATAAPSPYVATDVFLQKQFVDGKFVAGFTPGKPDFGFSIEALLQRFALGESKAGLAPAESYLLNSPTNTGTSASPSGFLFNQGRLKLGLAGKWAFVSAILGTTNVALRTQIMNVALSKIDGSGDLAADANANTFDRAWLVLGLAATKHPKQALSLARTLAGHQLGDGGFNDGYTQGVGSPDGTGITLQAIAAAKSFATQTDARRFDAVVAKAVRYLRTTAVQSHYESYGDANVNGTEYAAMGLNAVGADATGITAWLRGDLASDGGLKTPWSNGAGDAYASAQGAVALLGGSYASLLLKASQSQKGK